MGKTHIYRCILDTQEDVIRDISIDSGKTLQDLHLALVSAFGLKEGELASFFQVDEQWTPMQEIPLFHMDEQAGKEMKDFRLEDLFAKPEDKLLYVYDFLNYWTFYILLLKEEETSGDASAKLVFSKGEMPERAPERHFESEMEESFTDEEEYLPDEDFDEFGDGFDIEEFGDY